MEEQYAEKYHRLEKSHWWFVRRRDIIYHLIKDHFRGTGILEVGCSGGVLMEFLKDRGFEFLHGIDINREAIDICKQRGIDNAVVENAEKTGFGDLQFDLVIASDVLEHIRDEDKALLEWRRILKPGGTLIVFVPAFAFLWSDHDEINHHFRRYSRSELIERLEKNGFEVKRASYWNSILFLPVFFLRIFQRFLHSRWKGSGDQLYEMKPSMNTVLGDILRFENKLLSHGMNLPFGISVFAVAKRL